METKASQLKHSSPVSRFVRESGFTKPAYEIDIEKPGVRVSHLTSGFFLRASIVAIMLPGPRSSFCRNLLTAMQFHSTGTDPTPQALFVCRNARWNLLAVLAVLWAFPLLLWTANGSTWIVGLVAVVPALLTWPLLAAWRRRGRAENWVLAAYADGMWLNLRDCEYHAAQPGESIVFIPYSEIISVRRYIHRYVHRKASRSTHNKDVYLEIQLQEPTAGEIALALAEEWKRNPPPRTYFRGQVTSRTRRTQAPVAVEGDNLVHVKFTVGNYGLQPTLKKVLEQLGRFVHVDPDREPPKEDWDKLVDAEFDVLVHRLATTGQRFDAMKLLRQRKGISAREAKVAVEDLASHPAVVSEEPI